jgi:tetratricopeptide (TPR) repeat protein
MKKWFIVAFFFVAGIAVYGQPSSDDFQADSSIKSYDERIGRNPNDSNAYISRGNSYLVLGDFDHAFADYNKAIELNPADFFAYASRGSAYYTRRDYDKAIADYTHAATLANDERRADILYALSVVYAAKEDMKQSEKSLNEAKSLNPSYQDRRLSIYNEQLRRNPNDVYAYINRGNRNVSLGDFDRAFADYDKAIELDPTDFFVYASRGSAYYTRQDYDKAIADYTHAATLVDGERQSDILYALSVVYTAKGAWEQAEKNLNEAKRLNPFYQDMSIDRVSTVEIPEPAGKISESTGNVIESVSEMLESAREILKSAREMLNGDRAEFEKSDSADAPPPLVNQTDRYHDYPYGRYRYDDNPYGSARYRYQDDRATRYYNERIRRNPNDSRVYVERGGWYFSLGDFDHAFADYDKAIELDPTSEFAYVNRGNAYYMRQDYDKSIADYTYAATLVDGKEQAGVFYALFVVYAAKGDQEQAEKYLNEAKRLNPSYRDLSSYQASAGKILESAREKIEAAGRMAEAVSSRKIAETIGRVGEKFDSTDAPLTLVNTYTLDMDTLEYVDISHLSVEVLEADGEDFILKEFMKENEPDLYATFKNDGNTLNLIGESQNNLSPDTHKVELYIPASSVHTLNVLLRSGNISIENSVEKLDIRVQSGVVAVEDFNGELDILVQSGVATLSNFNGKGSLRINSGVASLEIAAMKGDMSVIMDSGIINLAIGEDVSCTLDMEVRSGFLNGSQARNRRPIKTTQTIGTAPEHTLTLSCSSGMVNLAKP